MTLKSIFIIGVATGMLSAGAAFATGTGPEIGKPETDECKSNCGEKPEAPEKPEPPREKPEPKSKPEPRSEPDREPREGSECPHDSTGRSQFYKCAEPVAEPRPVSSQVVAPKGEGR